MRKTITTLLLITIAFAQAQSIKIKKGEILVDKVKYGTAEKIKAKPKYIEIKDNNGQIVFNFKRAVEQSKLYGDLKHYNYFFMDAPTEKDSIGINKLLFHASDKKSAKFLIKHNLLTKDGINQEQLKKMLNERATKPDFVLKSLMFEKELMANIGHTVDRDKTRSLYVTAGVSGYGDSAKLKVTPRSSANVTSYAIYQDGDESRTNLIGFAHLERITNSSNHYIVITNTKGTPVLFKDTFNIIILHPNEEVKVPLNESVRMDEPVKAIEQAVWILIEKNKL